MIRTGSQLCWHVRGVSSVVQVISRNHSNVSKPAFVISKGLYCSSRNQLSSLFYCLLWNKTKKKASHLVIPSITQQTQPFLSEFDESPFARFRPFVDTSENNAKKFLGTTGESLICTLWVGLNGIWILSQITQNPLRLARNTHIVLRTTQTRLWLAIQAANYRGNYWQSYIKGSLSLEVPSFVLVEFRLEFIVNLLRRKTRFWFINHGSRRSSLSEGGLFSVRYWLGFQGNQLIFGPGQAQVHRECVETRWAIWLPSVSGMFEF